MERPAPPAAARPAPRARTAASLAWLVPAVTVGGLLPVAVLVHDALTGLLGANPFQRATRQTGLLALTLLVLSLACTPLRLATGWTWPARIRRSLGLLAFAYAALHLGIYLVDHGASAGVIVEDVVKRPFVTAGVTALLLLVPPALTSRHDSVRRLGFARWTRVHRLVYAAAWVGVLHYYWGVKKDHTPPLLYAALLAALFLARWALPRLRGSRRAGRAAGGR